MLQRRSPSHTHYATTRSKDRKPVVQAVPGVQPLPVDYNPATWMLEVSGGGAKMHTEAVKADFAAIYRDSAAHAETARRGEEIAERSKGKSEPLALASTYAAPLGRQISGLTRKLFIVYWCARLAVPSAAVSCSRGCTSVQRPHSDVQSRSALMITT